MQPMLLVECEILAYAEALELQRSIVDEKLVHGLEDVLLLLEHPCTITLGTRGSISDVLLPVDQLSAAGIAVLASDRGGQATYHGPGQLVAYPVVGLKALRLSVRAYVQTLEETIIQTLRHFGVEGLRKAGSAGIWIGQDEKIASIGVKIRRGIAYHGLSLNVSLQEDPSRFVVCCGMPRTRMVSMNDVLTSPVPMAAVRTTLAHALAEVMHVRLVPCPCSDLHDRLSAH